MKTKPAELKTVLVTDCGSTTTKAVLFERQAEGWRQTFRGEAPTTVENPVADVTVGALNAFREVEELSGRKIVTENATSGQSTQPFMLTESDPAQGIDLYLSTSSAGGGLQMIVTGLVKEMSAQSATRAALGAGAIVLDVVSTDDGREEHERVQRIRHLRPDIVLVTGGIDGGAKQPIVEIAEILAAASPRPRFGDTLQLPVIYAGNKDAAPQVAEILKPIAHIETVENIRPNLETENLRPARDAIHEFFLKHVMSHAPGYGNLLAWTPIAVMPTPAAVGEMVLDLATRRKIQVLAVDIGGATTDVFSVFEDPRTQSPAFNRTVSANLGMSYSVANVLIESGCENIARWLPFALSHAEISDRLRNKMIRPTSIPQTQEDLLLEQAVAREALRLSLQHHRSLAVSLSGTKQQRGIADIFSQRGATEELVDMLKLDLIIGSGGVLSHAPERGSAALMMVDAFEPIGVTALAVDSIFMMPHLGVLASVYPEAAHEILLRDCLVPLGVAIAPVFPAHFSERTVAEVKINGENCAKIERHKVTLLPARKQSGKVLLEIIPTASSVDIGAGAGKSFRKEVEGGVFGFILDGRNRPLELPRQEADRINLQRDTLNNLGLKGA